MRNSLNSLTGRSLLLLACLVCLHAARAQAQSTAFTYQGVLKQNGAPLNATADLQCGLFDALSGGAQVGSTVTVNSVNVADGLFTVSLDFGPSPFNGQQRWLQISVRSPAGSGVFTTLSPRQALTATPFALYALSGPGSGGPWAVNGNNVSNTNTGNVGIGTNAPATKLHMRTEEPVLILQDQGSNSTQVGYIGFWNNTPSETAWVGFGTPGSPHFSMVNNRGTGNIEIWSGTGGGVRIMTQGNERLIVNAAGNVGIGTSTPAAKLDVRGDIRLGSSGQLLASGGEESLRIVRGIVAADGSIFGGTGFTVNRFGTGQYEINFSPPFSGLPAVSYMTAFNDPVSSYYWRNLSSSSVEFHTFSDGYDDGIFTFIAIGPR